jgi:uncharacterized membrane protein YfcA
VLGSQRIAPSRPEPGRRARGLIGLLALAVGVLGGIYGIGGGSLLAPVLIASGVTRLIGRSHGDAKIKRGPRRFRA